MVFLKTHKTGSSSLMNIVQRWADLRNLTVMVPMEGHVNLGWSDVFPGVASRDFYSSITVDVICNHAILNKTLMDYYVSKKDNSPTTSSRDAYYY